MIKRKKDSYLREGIMIKRLSTIHNFVVSSPIGPRQSGSYTPNTLHFDAVTPILRKSGGDSSNRS